MKLSKREIEDLLTLVRHARTDLSFGEGGSYIKDNDTPDWAFDNKEAAAAKRAIEFIKNLIAQP